MSARISMPIWEPVQALLALNTIHAHVRPFLVDGQRLVVKVEPETRRDNHNRHFHSLIAQIARQVGGDLADAEDAKRILISAFKIDTRTDPALASEWAKFGEFRVGRGLRGETVLMGTQSRDFTIRLARAFIEWLYAFGIDCGVAFDAWEGE